MKKDADTETEEGQRKVGVDSANHPPITDTTSPEFNTENLLKAQTSHDTSQTIPIKLDAINNDNTLLYLL